MIAGIVLGMGMPTTPAYIIMTALLVPAIIKLGVIPPAAHMFAFYFAVLSAITPPVALAVYAAAGIAKSELWASGWAAVKIGAAGFIVPFMFIYEPALLMIGDWPCDHLAVRRRELRHHAVRRAGCTASSLRAATYWERALLVIGGCAFGQARYRDRRRRAGLVAVAVAATQMLTRRARVPPVRQDPPDEPQKTSRRSCAAIAGWG